MTSFAPELYIESGSDDISFYTEAFGAIESFRFNNEQGTLHVAELEIDGQIFHIHEQMPGRNFKSPENLSGNSICIGLFVDDVDAVMKKAVLAGALLVSEATDYDYGYRQGMICDPFGHYWQIQKKI